MNALAGLLRRGLSGAVALFGERRCPGCSGVFSPEPAVRSRAHDPAGRLFCRTCREGLPRKEKGLCPHCGEPGAWPNVPPALCGRCLADPPHWRNFVCHGVHEGLLRRLLIRLKFAGEVSLAHALGSLLAAHPALRRFAPEAGGAGASAQRQAGLPGF